MLISADCIVTNQEVLRPGWIEIDDRRIVGLGAGLPPRPADVGPSGLTIVPGFVDTHVHGGGGATFSDATSHATLAAVELHRAHGTTSLVASLVSAPPEEMLRQVDVLASHVHDGLLSGIHLEGPWLSPHRCGAHEPTALRRPELAELDAVRAVGRGTIRMITLAPELDGADEVIRRIVDMGAVAAIGHTDATYDQTRIAIEAGATVGTHLFNAMRPVHHREPGPVVALLQDERVTVEMIADGVHLHPALYQEVLARAGCGRVSLVTDAMAAAGMPDGAYELGPLAVDVVEGIARLAGAETIAGSTATMDTMFRFAVAHAGPDRDQALLSAVHQSSIVPARALGLPPAGLRTGAAADLVVLDDALGVIAVMRQGAWGDDRARGLTAR